MRSFKTNNINTLSAMAKTNSGTTARKLTNVKEILITPFTNGVKGSKIWVLDDIEANTLSITQDDPTVEAIQGETKSEPIDENIELGNYSIAASCCDVQKDLLVDLLGYTYDATSKIAYAPSTYKPIYAEFEVVFSTGDSFVCPKVKLNSKVDATSLKSGMAKIVIGGTCYSGPVKEGVNAPFGVKDAPTVPA